MHEKAQKGNLSMKGSDQVFVNFCASLWPKERESREGKALAGFDPPGTLKTISSRRYQDLRSFLASV